MKKFQTLVLAITLSASTSLFADCEVLMKLVNENDMEIQSVLQFGGVTAAQAAEITDDTCSKLTMELINNGTFKVSSTLQFGGVTAAQYYKQGGAN